MSRRLQGLYAITDETLTPDAAVCDQVEAALQAGATIIQYRNKSDDDDTVEAVCRRLQALCRDHHTLFIIDDRPELVRQIGADGVHVGKDDMPFSEVRRMLPDAIIGVSCYGSVKRALECQEAGADYVAFGSFFPSPTKPHSGIVPLDVLRKAKERLQIPVCAIGGIDVTNIHEVAALNPDMISVVSAAFDGDVGRNVKQLLQGMRL